MNVIRSSCLQVVALGALIALPGVASESTPVREPRAPQLHTPATLDEPKSQSTSSSDLNTVPGTLTPPDSAHEIPHSDSSEPDDEVRTGSIRRVTLGLTPLDVPMPGTSAVDHAVKMGESPELTPLTPQLIALRRQVRDVLTSYYPKHLNTREHSPWEVMHGIIAYGVRAQLFLEQPGGQKANAIGWMLFNGPMEGEQIFTMSGGKIVARKGPGLQGHYGQLLAILAQSHLQRDYPMKIQGRSFTLEDLIQHEMSDCEAGTELTFKLIGLAHYLDSDATWRSQNGQTWSISRLLHEELKQPIRGAACGGTHRLMGYSYSINRRAKQDKPIDGEFLRAATFLRDYHRYTFSLQNSDGSFSTEWFARRADKPDVDRKLKTSGHIIEWLAFSLSDANLRDARMIRAVDFLSGIMARDKEHAWEVGPVGHAIHALALYDRRVFQPHDQQLPVAALPAKPKATAPATLQPAESGTLKPRSTPVELRTAQQPYKSRKLELPPSERNYKPAVKKPNGTIPTAKAPATKAPVTPAPVTKVPTQAPVVKTPEAKPEPAKELVADEPALEGPSISKPTDEASENGLPRVKFPSESGPELQLQPEPR